MAGKSNTKWLTTMVEKHGSVEAVTLYMQSIGAKGGKNGKTGSFYFNRELASIAGRKGGTISRRGKSNG